MSTIDERQFSYDSVPLPDAGTHIRLLEICPVPDKNDELYCKLYTAPITNLPRYSAVSYAWGDNTKTHNIRIVDYDRPRTSTGEGLDEKHGRTYLLPITSSLDTCLRQFRTYKQIRLTPLWIDQVCINQDDDEEKSCQIQLMKQIYSSANNVYAWLGLDADGSDVVIPAFGQVAECMWDSGLFGGKYSTKWFPAPRAIFYNRIHTPEVQNLLRKVIPIVVPLLREKKILAWYKRRWFSRIWTIQEFCLNRYTFFVCGDRAVLDEIVLLVWEVFLILPDFHHDRRFRDAFKDHPEILSLIDSVPASLIPPPMQHLFGTKGSWKRGKQTTLRELLEEVSTRLDLGDNRLDIDSTKYRDRVYGLLGLASDAAELNIRPDYRKTTSTAEVLTSTARRIIEKEGSVYILRYAQFPKYNVKDPDEEAGHRSQPELPTWVPDWANGTHYSYQFLDGVYSTCGRFSNKVDIIPTSSPSILGLRGVLVDTIEAVGRPWRQEWGLEGYHRYILQYFSILKDMRRRSAEKNMNHQSSRSDDDDIIYYKNPSARNESIWRVPLGDCYVNGPQNRGRAKAEDVVPVFGELIDHCRFCFEFEEEQKERRLEQQERLKSSENDNGNGNGNDDDKNDNGNKNPPPPAEDLDQETLNYTSSRWEDLRSKGSYLHNMMHMDRKRPFLTSRKGYLGMAPEHAQPGDVVVLLCGDTIPYVLRPITAATGVEAGDGKDTKTGDGTEDDDTRISNTYTFVGEAYCDGIMDGELEGMLDEEAEGKRDEFFVV